jgi:hypothetical protein
MKTNDILRIVITHYQLVILIMSLVIKSIITDPSYLHNIYLYYK